MEKDTLLEKPQTQTDATTVIEPTPPVRDRVKIDEAIERVRQRYGHDLQAFFQDAYREVLLKQEAPLKVHAHK